MSDPKAKELERHASDYKPGTVLFREGDKGDTMYIIQRGSIEIRRHLGNKEHVLAVLGNGDFFGEMAIVNNRPRSAMAVVKTPSRLFAIGRETFELMLREKTEIAARMIRTMAQRLERANQQVELLLVPDSSHRLVQLVRKIAEEERVEPQGSVYIKQSAAEIAQRTALPVEEVEEILKRLSKALLIMKAVDTPGYIVPEVGRLLEFLEIQEMRERKKTEP
jgi:CRP-like cAMP-binding protein